MEWKPFYRSELESAAGRAAVRAALDACASPEPELVESLRGGGVLSFPHTTLHASALPIARVVAAVRAARPSRVLALGVLHGAVLPEPFCALHAAHSDWLRSGTEPNRLVERAFEELRGAFWHTAPPPTPWGEVPHVAPPPASDILRAGDALLEHEFSLDLFLALHAAYARERGEEPLPVLPLYVLLTRDSAGGFATATALARELAPYRDGGTAFVTTGDFVHYGTAYSSAEEMRGLPGERAALERHFLPLVREALDAALVRRDFADFYRSSLAPLRNDQRNVLPVIAELLGKGARADIQSFELTDYSGIWGVTPPCVVASALVSYRPHDGTDTESHRPGASASRINPAPGSW